jgi:hypothetical protein
VCVSTVVVTCAAISVLPSCEIMPVTGGIASPVAVWPVRGPVRIVSV